MTNVDSCIGGGYNASMRKKLQAAIMSTPDLPSGFTECEYLESTGTQHIELTDLKLSNKHSVTCAYTPLGYQWVNFYYGAQDFMNDGNNSFCASYNYNNSWGQLCHIAIANKFSSISGPHCILGKKYTSYADSSCFTVTDVGSITFKDIPEFTVQRSTWLFKVWASNNSTSTCGPVRIHSFIVKESGITIYDLIPALDASGKPCMFDSISRQCFYNKTKSGEDFKYKIKSD